MRVTRKYEAVDIMKLWTLGSANGWNKVLDDAVSSLNIDRLARLRYSLQAGMTDLANQKLNDEKMIDFYLRLMKSLENTARQIIRIKHPMPNDNPMIKVKDRPKDAIEAKRRRDKELEEFFNRSSF